MNEKTVLWAVAMLALIYALMVLILFIRSRRKADHARAALAGAAYLFGLFLVYFWFPSHFDNKAVFLTFVVGVLYVFARLNDGSDSAVVRHGAGALAVLVVLDIWTLLGGWWLIGIVTMLLLAGKTLGGADTNRRAVESEEP